jgi:hypothetical protein
MHWAGVDSEVKPEISMSGGRTEQIRKIKKTLTVPRFPAIKRPQFSK